MQDPGVPTQQDTDMLPGAHEGLAQEDKRLALEFEPGMAGPGLRPNRGLDPSLVAAWLFVAIGWTPVSWWEAVLGRGYFGPIALPAVLAMVGVLFAFIAILRSIDLADLRLRAWAGVALSLGLVRLFLLPLL